MEILQTWNNDNIANSESFRSKIKTKENTPGAGNIKMLK